MGGTVHMVGCPHGLVHAVREAAAPRLRASRGRPRERTRILVIGPDAEDPVGLAQEAHRVAPDATVVLVTSPGGTAEVHALLLTAPGVGKDLHVVDLEAALSGALAGIVRGSVARRRSQARLREANEFLRRAMQLL